MPSAELGRRVGEVVAYPPLCDMGADQRREFHEALLDADGFEDLPGKWQAAILKAEQNRPQENVKVDGNSSGRSIDVTVSLKRVHHIPPEMREPARGGLR
jgi:hypothetical protein